MYFREWIRLESIIYGKERLWHLHRHLSKLASGKGGVPAMRMQRLLLLRGVNHTLLDPSYLPTLFMKCIILQRRPSSLLILVFQVGSYRAKEIKTGPFWI
jgi:hypothetical protein